MHDALRVRGVERVDELGGNLDDLSQRQSALPQTVGQRLALDELHRDVADSVAVANVVDRRDVGMIEG